MRINLLKYVVLPSGVTMFCYSFKATVDTAIFTCIYTHKNIHPTLKKYNKEKRSASEQRDNFTVQ